MTKEQFLGALQIISIFSAFILGRYVFQVPLQFSPLLHEAYFECTADGGYLDIKNGVLVCAKKLPITEIIEIDRYHD